MLKNKVVRWSLKIISAIVSFVVLFMGIQILFTPKYEGTSTTIVDGMKHFTNEKLDALFLGSSQMFCSVNAKVLTEEYDLSSYDYGASNQYLTTTTYYCNEALRHCKPKMVLVELGNLFCYDAEADDKAISWNYAPMSMSLEKYNSLVELTQDYPLSFKYSFCPLFEYHSRWNDVITSDINYFKNYDNPDTYSNRGFVEKTVIMPMQMSFDKSSTDTLLIPSECKKALLEIKKICNDNNIKLYCFKVPVSFWTRTHSSVTQKFMDENNIDFVDFHNYLDELKIDPQKDFHDTHHVNGYGSKKVTEFIGRHLTKTGFDISQ